MFFNNPSDIFDYLLGFLNKGDAVADATVGNGNDTLKLSNAVGKSGRVYGFDIQSAAIESAKKKEYVFENVQFINATHSDADKYIKEELAAAVFNLGYLPGGDHSIATKAESTISAIEKFMRMLKPNGYIFIEIYRGGDSGFSESNAVLEFLKGIDYKKFNVLLTDYINRPKNPPMVCVIQKKAM